MELIKIINARKTIEGLSERDDIGLHLSYWMAKFVARTQKEQEFFSLEITKLFNKYGQAGEDGTLIIPRENAEKFNLDLRALEQTDVEDPEIRFDLSELSSELKLTIKQIYPLLDFINEGK